MASFHVPPLTTLEAKLSPRHAALLVIDVQNDFIADDGAMAQEGFDVSMAQEMAQRVPAVVEAARESGTLVVFVRNVYNTVRNNYLSDVWLEQAQRRRGGNYVERPVCPPDSWQGDFFGELGPLPDEPIVSKHRFDAFLDTDLDLILRTHGIRTLVLVGVATNVCVETTARHGFLSDYYVVLPSDGAAAYGDAEHEASLRTIDKYFGEVSTCAEVTSIWAKSAAEEPGPVAADSA